MSDFLLDTARASAARCAAARAREPEAAMRARASAFSPPLSLCARDRFVLIAEVKFASPSAGPLQAIEPSGAGERAIELALAYEAGGASAISVLTEPSRFGGSLEHLRGVAARVRTPVMRKDFLVDPYQVVEARAHGASGVLLITRMLDDRTLGAMLHEAASLGMFTLVEGFDHSDLERAARVIAPVRARLPGAVILEGVNSRDLSTLQVSAHRTADLLACFAPGACAISESGLSTPDDVGEEVARGFDGVLVGSALMRSVDPRDLCARMVRHGEEAFALRCGARHAEQRAARMKVKVCGLTREQDVTAALEAGADVLGFVLADSPRRVSVQRLRDLVRNVPPGIVRVGVVRGNTADEMRALGESGAVDWIQADLGEAELVSTLAPRVRTLAVLRDGRDASAVNAARAARLASSAPMVLVEGSSSGTGTRADWERVARLPRWVSLGLAGGLNPQNVGEAVRRVDPVMVDVSSGVEASPGVKDAALVRAFVRNAREAQA